MGNENELPSHSENKRQTKSAMKAYGVQSFLNDFEQTECFFQFLRHFINVNHRHHSRIQMDLSHQLFPNFIDCTKASSLFGHLLLYVGT